MQKAFRNVLVIVIIGVIIFGLFSYLNGNGNMPKQLTYNQFTEKLEKGDLKTLEIQPQQNVYMVSGKTKNDEDYSSTILYNNEKELQKITDAAKKQNGVKLTIKEEEKEQTALRKAYLESFRKGFKQQIENTKVIDPEGNDVTPEKIKEIQQKRDNKN